MIDHELEDYSFYDFDELDFDDYLDYLNGTTRDHLERCFAIRYDFS